MHPRALLRPVLLYTVGLGLLTVAVTYVATYSALSMLGLAGAGVLLAAVGGGAAGSGSAYAGEHTDGDRSLEVVPLWGGEHSVTSLRLVLAFYGAGVCLWSLVVLFALRDTLA